MNEVDKISNDDWPKWSKHVIIELQNLRDDIKDLKDDLADVKNAYSAYQAQAATKLELNTSEKHILELIANIAKDLAILKTEFSIKSGLWGLIGGILAFITAWVLRIPIGR